MKKSPKMRTYEERMELLKDCAKYIVRENATIRSAAKKFDISKSWVYHNIEFFLFEEDAELYRKVRKVIDKNKSERHIRGGMATKLKYIKKANSH